MLDACAVLLIVRVFHSPIPFDLLVVLEVKAPTTLGSNEVVPLGFVLPDLVTDAEEHGGKPLLGACALGHSFFGGVDVRDKSLRLLNVTSEAEVD